MKALFLRILAAGANQKLALSHPSVSARFAATLQDKNNPDHIILAHILQSFATEFDSWVFESVGYPFPKKFDVCKYNSNIHSRSSNNSGNRTLKIFKRGAAPISVVCELSQRTAYVDETYEYFFTELNIESFRVNETPLSLDLCIPFLSSVADVRNKHEELKATAARVRAEMEVNEKKWELAESLLGMKRENGLLRPVKTLCGCENDEACESCTS